MNPLAALHSLKAVSQAVGQFAAKVGETTLQAAGSASSPFHELLAKDNSAAKTIGQSGKSTAELRQQIAEIAERVMKSIGFSLDQPVRLTASDDGHLRIDANHPQSAEVEMALDSDPQLPGLVNELLSTSDAAARHFVLHRVPEPT